MGLLPLFPLDLVLLPQTPLPLHIFEPRYKEMIGECLAMNESFGVIRAVDQGLAEIGCTAEIVKVTRKYSDGRMDLIAKGLRRFEVLALNEDRAFLRAEVLFIPDETGEPDEQEMSRALRLHSEILSLAGASLEVADSDSSALSFRLAGSLPLDLDFKQKLLGIRSEADRIHALTDYFETILPGLRRAARARQKAGGNGHVH